MVKKWLLIWSSISFGTKTRLNKNEVMRPITFQTIIYFDLLFTYMMIKLKVFKTEVKNLMQFN